MEMATENVFPRYFVFDDTVAAEHYSRGVTVEPVGCVPGIEDEKSGVMFISSMSSEVSIVCGRMCPC